ncbi:MAG: type IV toxin-antitoxin system AbiEi family antitoxin [Polyangiaceae bacterium]
MGINLPSERQMIARAPAALAEALGVPASEVTTLHRGKPSEPDIVVSVADQTFNIECKGVVAAGAVAAYASRIAETAKKIRRAVPLLVVPFMGQAARRASEEAHVSWLDLSGNAHIIAPGLRVIIEGRSNQFLVQGRRKSAFAPKSARVVRFLLINPERAYTQREIARETEMTDGFVSQIVTRLEADGYVTRSATAKQLDAGESRAHPRAKAPIRVRDPALLLDAWREEYRFEAHTIMRGHIPARTGDALVRGISEKLVAEGIPYAATGLAAAWELTHFAMFRIATFFLESEPSPSVLKRLSFRDDERGANVWLAIPNDSGVFLGARERDGVRCVHPVQAYLDLKGHPERAAEAADTLKAEYLDWKRDA